MHCIAAVSENWGIGKNNQLLYHIPDDMKFFRNMTLNHTVIMGRNTYESIGKPLPNRECNVILTSDTKFEPKKDKTTHTMQIYTLEQLLGIYAKDPNAFIIGGARLYESCLDYCETAYITLIHDVKPADTFFPNLYTRPNWEIDWYKPEKTYEGITYQHMIFRNKNVKPYVPTITKP